MKPQIWNRWEKRPNLALSLKYGGILLLFLFSTLIVACGGGAENANTVNTNGPAVTVTIRMGTTSASPTPKLPSLWCGAWATQSTPLYDADHDEKATVAVYAKFTQNVNGNPVGIGGAAAHATVYWPGGSTEQLTASTTSDGLAVFFVSIHNKGFAVGKVTLVTVAFEKTGVGKCNVDLEHNPAFFSLLAKPSPTPDKKKHDDHDDDDDDDDDD